MENFLTGLVHHLPLRGRRWLVVFFLAEGKTKYEEA
jgi:hypothetical protein